MSRKLPVVSAAESSFPELDRRWLAEALAHPLRGDTTPPELPVEERATCDTCVMLDADPRSEIDVQFSPDTKCCTIVPFLESFRIGAILDSDLPGRDIIETRIDARGGVTPLGIGPTREQREIDDRMRQAGRFGQDHHARCPYYLADGGRCSVWHHRNSSCATYHCRFVRGRFGANLWRALQNMLGAVERTLSRWCLLELDFDDDALAELFPPKSSAIPGTPRPDPHAEGVYERVWGSWLGRERELYRRAAALVAPLGWSDVLGIAGPDVALLARAANVALRRWQDQSLPDTLHVRPHRAAAAGLMSLRVRGYSSLDPADFPMQVVAALPLFDGRPTDAVRRDAQSTFGTRLDEDTLRQLYELGALDG